MTDFTDESAFSEREKTDAQLREEHISRLLAGQDSFPGMEPPGPTPERSGSPAHEQATDSERLALLINDAQVALDNKRPHIANQILEEIRGELDANS